MPELSASQLFETGRAHGLSAALLYQAAIEEGTEHNLDDPEHYAFHGSYSLSIYHLSALAFELMLKGAFVAKGGCGDEKTLKSLGHGLVSTLDAATRQGFHSEAPRLGEIMEVIDRPYRDNFFRYHRPDQFGLPVMQHVIECFAVLDDELRELIGI